MLAFSGLSQGNTRIQKKVVIVSVLHFEAGKLSQNSLSFDMELGEIWQLIMWLWMVCESFFTNQYLQYIARWPLKTKVLVINLDQGFSHLTL